MRYNLHHSILTQDIKNLIKREMQRKKMKMSHLSKKELKDLNSVSQKIKKFKIPKYLICKKLNKELGYGIFLHPNAAPILKGSLIAPYTGEVSLVPQNDPDDSAYAFSLASDIHLKKEEQLLLDKKRRFHPRRLYNLKLDASKNGNFTRYINHSEKPNVIAYLVEMQPDNADSMAAPLEIVYFAKKDILPKEQLLVSYEEGGKYYWNAKMKPFPMTPKTFELTSSCQIIRNS